MNFIKEYRDFLLFEKRYSNHTVSAYIKDIELISRYFPKRSPEILTRAEIEEYIAALFDHIESTSLHRKISSIRQFYLFLCKREFRADNPASALISPKKGAHLPSLLTFDEISQLIQFNYPDTILGHRNRAIVELLYSSGIRVGELVSLTVSNIDFSEKNARIFGKGKKERIVPLTEFSAQTIETYLFKRGDRAPNHALFYNKNSTPLTSRGVQYIIDKTARAAGIYKKVTPHMLRHSFASHFLENGLNLRYLQHMLGHSNLATTELYTHLSIHEIKKIYDKSHPDKN